MFTQPSDLPEETLRAALADGWRFGPAALSYQPVGFGSHHWLATDSGGGRLFATVDDLAAKLTSRTDSTDAAFGRLDRAFAAALSLRRDCGLRFVAAPLPARDGQVLVRLQDGYSLVVHRYLDGEPEGAGRGFRSPAEREAQVQMLAALHGARPAALPLTDDFAVPNRDELAAALRQTGQPWTAGPYGERARNLLAAHAAGLARLLAACEQLASRVAGRPDRMVVTHGEPGAHNTMRTPAGPVLVDWDSALLAAPERDLWDLAQHDRSVLPAYSAVSGTAIDEDALAFYRMWYDLFEIAGYLRLFRERHNDTADAAESWRNLVEFLRPAARWPELFLAPP
ncbi:MAG TPA: phosphotransferase [Streptosporangiaceae bacterium]|jgi:spectinomycin phosphotransferase/16S rRNA (guanine(1405)-N(7))-methyltransferase